MIENGDDRHESDEQARAVVMGVANEVLRAGDVLIVQARMDDVARLGKEEGLALLPEVKLSGDDELEAGGFDLAEVLVAPLSGLIGKTIKEANFRETYGCFVVAIRRVGVTLRNKIDLSGDAPGPAGDGVINISARHGQGIDALREDLRRRMGYREANTGVLMARRRHLLALQQTEVHLAAAAAGLRDGTDAALVAEELRLAQERLGEITGAFTSEDLLGRIFATFCIGK